MVRFPATAGLSLSSLLPPNNLVISDAQYSIKVPLLPPNNLVMSDAHYSIKVLTMFAVTCDLG